MTRPDPGARRSARAVCLALLLGLAACSSTPTPYQAATSNFGYRDQQLENNRYRVSFAGNSATSPDAVQDYALYRAAELTLASGHDYFRVVDRNTESRSTGVGGPQVGIGVGSGGSNLGVGLSTFLGGGGYAEDYSVTLDILTFAGEKPAGDTDSYDAHELLRRLQPSIQRPPA
jgi:hypothetical protein